MSSAFEAPSIQISLSYFLRQKLSPFDLIKIFVIEVVYSWL